MTQMTFEGFVAERLPRLLRTASSICGDPGVAEDPLQNVLMKVYERWDHVGSLANPDGYIYRMIVNEAVSWHRKWSRRGAVHANDVLLADHAEQHADRAEIAAVLKRLPARQRAVLTLRYYNSLTDTEIAEVMGCSPGTVRGYASRALAELRLRLPDHDKSTSGRGEPS